MVSCLTLISCAHALLDQHDGVNFTACGLSIEEQHVDKTLFAETLDTVTCQECRQRIARNSGKPAKPAAMHPKAVVIRLIEQAVNGRDADCLAMSIGGEFASQFDISRITRLHELFEGWHADIRELIAEGETVVARYEAGCVDRFGLLGRPQIKLERQQAVIFQVWECRIIGARAIVDDFRLWGSPGEQA
jgi:hypothetical protein